jgi:hypothetical protein
MSLAAGPEGISLEPGHRFAAENAGELLVSGRLDRVRFFTMIRL